MMESPTSKRASSKMKKKDSKKKPHKESPANEFDPRRKLTTSDEFFARTSSSDLPWENDESGNKESADNTVEGGHSKNKRKLTKEGSKKKLKKDDSKTSEKLKEDGSVTRAENAKSKSRSSRSSTRSSKRSSNKDVLLSASSTPESSSSTPKKIKRSSRNSSKKDFSELSSPPESPRQKKAKEKLSPKKPKSKSLALTTPSKRKSKSPKKAKSLVAVDSEVFNERMTQLLVETPTTTTTTTTTTAQEIEKDKDKPSKDVSQDSMKDEINRVEDILKDKTKGSTVTKKSDQNANTAPSIARASFFTKGLAASLDSMKNDLKEIVEGETDDEEEEVEDDTLKDFVPAEEVHGVYDFLNNKRSGEEDGGRGNDKKDEKDANSPSIARASFFTKGLAQSLDSMKNELKEIAEDEDASNNDSVEEEGENDTMKNFVPAEEVGGVYDLLHNKKTDKEEEDDRPDPKTKNKRSHQIDNSKTSNLSRPSFFGKELDKALDSMKNMAATIAEEDEEELDEDAVGFYGKIAQTAEGESQVGSVPKQTKKKDFGTLKKPVELSKANNAGEKKKAFIKLREPEQLKVKQIRRVDNNKTSKLARPSFFANQLEKSLDSMRNIAAGIAEDDEDEDEIGEDVSGDAEAMASATRKKKDFGTLNKPVELRDQSQKKRNGKEALTRWREPQQVKIKTQGQLQNGNAKNMARASYFARTLESTVKSMKGVFEGINEEDDEEESDTKETAPNPPNPDVGVGWLEIVNKNKVEEWKAAPKHRRRETPDVELPAQVEANMSNMTRASFFTKTLESTVISMRDVFHDIEEEDDESSTNDALTLAPIPTVGVVEALHSKTPEIEKDWREIDKRARNLSRPSYFSNALTESLRDMQDVAATIQDEDDDDEAAGHQIENVSIDIQRPKLLASDDDNTSDEEVIDKQTAKTLSRPSFFSNALADSMKTMQNMAAVIKEEEDEETAGHLLEHVPIDISRSRQRTSDKDSTSEEEGEDRKGIVTRMGKGVNEAQDKISEGHGFVRADPGSSLFDMLGSNKRSYMSDDDELEELRNLLYDTRQELQEERQMSENAKSEIPRLQQELSNLEIFNAAELEKVRALLEEANGNLQAEKETIKAGESETLQQLNPVLAEQADLLEKLTTLEIEKRDIEENLSTLQVSNQNFQDKITELESMASQAQQEKEESLLCQQEQEKVGNDLMLELETCAAYALEVSEQKEEHTRAVQDLKEQLQLSQAECDDAKAHIERHTQDAEAVKTLEGKETQDQVEFLKAQLEEAKTAQSVQDSVQEELEEQRQKTKSAVDELSALKAEASESAKAAQELADANQIAVETLREDLASSKESVVHMETELKGLQIAKEEVTERFENDICQLKSFYDDVDKKAGADVDENDRLLVDFESFKTAKSKMQQKIETLERQLEAAKHDTDENTSLKNALQKSLDEQIEMNKSSQQVISSLMAVAEDSAKARSQLIEDNKGARDSVEAELASAKERILQIESELKNTQGMKEETQKSFEKEISALRLSLEEKEKRDNSDENEKNRMLLELREKNDTPVAEINQLKAKEEEDAASVLLLKQELEYLRQQKAESDAEVENMKKVYTAETASLREVQQQSEENSKDSQNSYAKEIAELHALLGESQDKFKEEQYHADKARKDVDELSERHQSEVAKLQELLEKKQIELEESIRNHASEVEERQFYEEAKEDTIQRMKQELQKLQENDSESAKQKEESERERATTAAKLCELEEQFQDQHSHVDRLETEMKNSNVNHESKIERLKAKEQADATELLKLNEELESLRNSNSESLSQAEENERLQTTEIANLQGLLDQKEEEMKDLSSNHASQIEHLQSKHEERENVLQKKEQDLQLQKDRESEFSNQMEAREKVHSAELEHLRLALAKLQGDFLGAKDQIKEGYALHSTERETMKAKETEDAALNQNLKEELESLKLQNAALNTRLEDAGKSQATKVLDLEEEVKSAGERNVQLQGRLKESETLHASAIAIQEANEANYQEEIATLNASIQDLQENESVLLRKVKDADALQASEREELQRQLQEADGQLADFKQKDSEMLDQLHDAEARLSDQREETEELKKVIENYKSSEKENGQLIAQSKLELSDKEQQIADLNNGVEKAQRELEETKKQMESLSFLNTESAFEIETLRQGTQDLNAKVKLLEEEKNAASREQGSRAIESKKNKEQLNKQKEKMKKLEEDVRKWKSAAEKEAREQTHNKMLLEKLKTDLTNKQDAEGDDSSDLIAQLRRDKAKLEEQIGQFMQLNVKHMEKIEALSEQLDYATADRAKKLEKQLEFSLKNQVSARAIAFEANDMLLEKGVSMRGGLSVQDEEIRKAAMKKQKSAFSFW